MTAAAAAIGWVAAYGLPGTLHEAPVGPLGATAWAELLGDANAEHLSGHLLRAIDDGALTATPDQRAQASTSHLTKMRDTLARERQLLRMAAALESAGIDIRVLLDPACAHEDYPDPSLRPYERADLLVGGADLGRAVEVARGLGFRTRRERGRGGTGDVLVDDTGLVIGFDNTIASAVDDTGTRGSSAHRVRMSDVWAANVPTFVIGGTPLPTLRPEYRFLHACFQVAGHGEPRLIELRDLAQMLLFGAPDPARIRAAAADWKCEAVLAHTVRAAWHALRLADVLDLSAWALSHRIDPREHRARLRDKARHAVATAWIRRREPAGVGPPPEGVGPEESP